MLEETLLELEETIELEEIGLDELEEIIELLIALFEELLFELLLEPPQADKTAEAITKIP